MDSRLQGRIAVITGASSGIGRATALRFASSGARIVCADLKCADVEKEITDKHGNDAATFITCDVTKEDQIEKLMREAVSWGGRLDIVCNYAGIAAEGAGSDNRPLRCHELPTELFDKTMSINTRGVWLCCKYALQQMMNQEPQEPNARGDRTRGWIVNAASILGLVGHPNTSGYTTSKHAVVGMTKQMGIDYAQDRIHVNCVCPGFVDSPLITNVTSNPEVKAAVEAKHPWNALGRPEDIADAALFLCSDESAWVTGHSLVIDGAYTAQ